MTRKTITHQPGLHLRAALGRIMLFLITMAMLR
jgi:hypothetical protein